jgi:anaerobic selenocysteine-containing dehydrogenase
MNARVDTSPKVADEVKTTTCYMCACRCGIKVHLKDGKVRYIQGNPDHPVNKGVLCAKGSAGIMQQYSPARLSKPLLRVGDRGSGEFKEIEWSEAIQTAIDWLKPIREEDPSKLAFFTGRDQSQALTGWWATQFRIPNDAAHGGFCSVNMVTSGIYSICGSLWEFGEPDWERTKYLMMFGVAEDHDSNPIKTGLGKVKANGAKFVSVNPVRTGYSPIATVFCTGQIYASLPTIRQWNHALSTPVYLVFALASGALFLNVLIRGFGGAEQWCDIMVILSLVAAWALTVVAFVHSKLLVYVS